MIDARTVTDNEDAAARLNRLLEELAMARQMLEEIQDDLAWAIMSQHDRNRVGPTPLRIASLPLDPSVPDWAERVNRFSAADVCGSTKTEHAPPIRKQQGHLF